MYDQLKAGSFELHDCDSSEMRADIFTKFYVESEAAKWKHYCEIIGHVKPEGQWKHLAEQSTPKKKVATVIPDSVKKNKTKSKTRPQLLLILAKGLSLSFAVAKIPGWVERLAIPRTASSSE